MAEAHVTGQAPLRLEDAVAIDVHTHVELSRAGGAEYLHTLTGLVPTAANAGYYAKIVAERAILRRLVEAGTRIVQLGYSGVGNELTHYEVDPAAAQLAKRGSISAWLIEWRIVHRVRIAEACFAPFACTKSKCSRLAMRSGRARRSSERTRAISSGTENGLTT